MRRFSSKSTVGAASFRQTVRLPVSPRELQPGATVQNADEVTNDLAYVDPDSGEYTLTSIVLTVDEFGNVSEADLAVDGALLPNIWPGRINGSITESDDVVYAFSFTAGPEAPGSQPRFWADGKAFAVYTIDGTYSAGIGTISASVNGLDLNQLTIEIIESAIGE